LRTDLRKRVNLRGPSTKMNVRKVSTVSFCRGEKGVRWIANIG